MTYVTSSFRHRIHERMYEIPLLDSVLLRKRMLSLWSSPLTSLISSFEKYIMMKESLIVWDLTFSAGFTAQVLGDRVPVQSTLLPACVPGTSLSGSRRQELWGVHETCGPIREVSTLSVCTLHVYLVLWTEFKCEIHFHRSLIESEELSEYIHYKIFLDEDFTSTAKFTVSLRQLDQV